MKIETLKKLIDIVDDIIVDDKKEFTFIINKLFELYDEDNQEPTKPTPSTPLNPFNPFNPWVVPNKPNPYIGGGTGDIVRYGDLCSCNPKNGGSGICGCTIGNKIVENPCGTTTSTSTSI